MPRYGKTSRARLETCHEDLQRVFNEVIKTIDCSVLEGIRTKEKQDRMYAEKKSKFKYPKSNHNVTEPNGKSLAVDVTPYPLDWKDRERQTLFAGYVLATARSMGILLRWGGDWDMDFQVNDNKFDDFPHFELR